jgi:acetylglutamate kinase
MAIGAVGNLHQVGQRQLVVGGELFQVDDVLEDVGVQRTFGQREVGLDVVVELDQLDLVALAFPGSA